MTFSEHLWAKHCAWRLSHFNWLNSTTTLGGSFSYSHFEDRKIEVQGV